MIIYSESFHVEHTIEKDWIQWFKEVYIPKIYQTQKFKKSVFTKVISHPEETGNTYSIQLYADTKEKLNEYYKEDSQEVHQLIFSRFGNQILSFKTELEVIEVFDF
ncbi:DUF4286 family protein [Apibacter raozihei]|uniref:DUF4286 family protein n=1 Tax=Apibacter TaxID=1778601 RepID=UPI000FE342A6|nr:MULTISPECIES: DUF4286 family protein [Apibacter]